MSEPPSSVLIRAQEPEDMTELTELLNQPRAVWGTLQLPYMSVADRRRRSEATDTTMRLVAVIGGKVIGSSGFERGVNRRAHTALIGMAVHDAYAGRGAGTALMAAMVERADRWLGLKRLELNVFADNVRAIALYERFGFEREGLLRAYAYRDGAFVDSIPMARLRD